MDGEGGGGRRVLDDRHGFEVSLADEMDDALEEIDEPLGPGIDDAGPGEHGELLGSFLERSPGRFQGPGQKLGVIMGPVALRVYGIGPVPDEGDHGPLDRDQDGPGGIGDRLLDGFGEMRGGDPALVAELAADAVDVLGEDEAGVAAGAMKSGLGDGSQGPFHGPGGDRPAGDGLHGRGQVGARVGVGDGEDVDLVEIVLVLDDGIPPGQEGMIQPRSVEIFDLHVFGPGRKPQNPSGRILSPLFYYTTDGITAAGRARL
jgi:hypothetical protein